MATPVKTIPRPEYNGDPEALLDAVEREDLETVITLIDAGIDIEYSNKDGEDSCEGMTAMIYTASMAGYPNNVAIMKELIRGGGDVNAAWCDRGTAADARVYGWTPLQICAYWRGDEEMIKLLVNAGADIDATRGRRGSREEGQTALHAAMNMCNCCAVKTLVQLGANTEVKDNAGRTVFMVMGDEV